MVADELLVVAVVILLQGGGGRDTAGGGRDTAGGGGGGRDTAAAPSHQDFACDGGGTIAAFGRNRCGVSRKPSPKAAAKTSVVATAATCFGTTRCFVCGDAAPITRSVWLIGSMVAGGGRAGCVGPKDRGGRRGTGRSSGGSIGAPIGAALLPVGWLELLGREGATLGRRSTGAPIGFGQETGGRQAVGGLEFLHGGTESLCIFTTGSGSSSSLSNDGVSVNVHSTTRGE
jgi:hypothetical protein